MTKVFFRADGNKDVGLGHIIRSMALADILKSNFECHCLIKDPSDLLRKEILKSCQSIINIPHSNSPIDEAISIQENHLSEKDICVLDGYNFETEYQSQIKKSGCTLISIDDIYKYHFVSDIIINHAPIENKTVYSIAPYSQLFTGFNYSLLRKPFLHFKALAREISKIEKVFICFGGSDLNNLTQKVLTHLIEAKSNIDHVDIVLGSANIWHKQIIQISQSLTFPEIVIHRNLSATEMSSLIQACDLAIVPSSSILFEVAKLNIPSISGYYIDNQLDVYRGYKNLGLIWPANDLNTFDKYESAINDIENGGAKKIMELQQQHLSTKSDRHLLDLFINHDPNIICRNATSRDTMIYYNWVCDPLVRSNSISTSEISLSEHKTWFQNKMNDEFSVMYIIEKANKPIGQVRFDIAKDKVVIDYSVDKNFRGKRLGKVILKISMKKYKEEMNKGSKLYFQGVVHKNNHASKNIFESLHFTPAPLPNEIDNNNFLNYIKEI